MDRSLVEIIKEDNIDKYKSNFLEAQISVAHLGNWGCLYMAGMQGRKRGIAHDNDRKEGRGQINGLLTFTDEDFRKSYPHKCWKIIQETQFSTDSIWFSWIMSDCMSDDSLLGGQVLLRKIRW